MIMSLWPLIAVQHSEGKGLDVNTLSL